MRNEFETEVTLKHNDKWRTYTVLGVMDIGEKKRLGPGVTRMSLDPDIRVVPYLKDFDIEEVLDEDMNVVDPGSWPPGIFLETEEALKEDLDGPRYSPEDEMRVIEAGLF